MKDQLLAQDIKNALLESGADTSDCGPIIIGLCDTILMGTAPPPPLVSWLIEEHPWPVGHAMNLSQETASACGRNVDKIAVWDALKLLG